jgi:hypothetical protein
MTTNYETITVLYVSEIEMTDRLSDLITWSRNHLGRNLLSAYAVVADDNAGPWGLIHLPPGIASEVLRALPGADIDGGPDEYAEYCDRITNLPQYLGNL